MARLKRPAGLVGVSGLTAAIIAQATVDAINADRETMLDSWEYFAGDWYRYHADALGIASDTWPAALRTLEADDYIRVTEPLLER